LTTRRWTRKAILRITLGLVVAVVGAIGYIVLTPYRGHLEVWNRTTTPIDIVGLEQTFEVPACGHVARDDFDLDRYDIHDDHGRFVAWRGGGGHERAFEMVTGVGPTALAGPASNPLPPCAGVLVGQSVSAPSVPYSTR
jgi:hypothetical protein